MIKPYLIFLDTEASDKPSKWNDFTSNWEEWPYLVQISWVIYTASGEEVKRENMYVNDRDFRSTATALKIHGITDQHRQSYGSSRNSILDHLTEDLKKYDALLVCHFVHFDLCLLKIEFDRAGVFFDLRQIPSFCTMRATKNLDAGTGKQLRLNELYAYLFYEKLANHHDALSDARATAKCFFELSRIGRITQESIQQQVNEEKKYMARL